MRFRNAALSVVLLLFLASCGLKRNLELPGQEKHPAEDQSNTSPATASQPSSPASPAAAPTPAPTPAPTLAPTDAPAINAIPYSSIPY